ncbi:hypothetical protein [Mesorhizobium ephedrae]|uniref:hypothetical protein n=1 Tax=Kumtagia ephedrae TaxID=2116701 RepID=UPI001FE0AA03
MAEVQGFAFHDGFDMEEADFEWAARLAIDEEFGDIAARGHAGKSTSEFASLSMVALAGRD